MPASRRDGTFALDPDPQTPNAKAALAYLSRETKHDPDCTFRATKRWTAGGTCRRCQAWRALGFETISSVFAWHDTTPPPPLEQFSPDPN